MQIYVVAGFEDGATSLPSNPILYSKGDELIRKEYPFFPKDMQECYWAIPSLAVRIGKLGKEVASRFAPRYIDKIGVGFDLVAFKPLQKAQQNGLPWDTAVAFLDAVGLSFEESSFDGILPNHYRIDFGVEGEANEKGACFSILGSLIQEATSLLSHHRKIRQGDILLLHPTSPLCAEKRNAICVQREQNIWVSTAGTTYRLKIR